MPKQKRAAQPATAAYTPRCVVKLLVESRCSSRTPAASTTPAAVRRDVRAVGRVHPAHASANGNGGRAKSDISIYGQESNYTTWRQRFVDGVDSVDEVDGGRA